MTTPRNPKASLHNERETTNQGGEDQREKCKHNNLTRRELGGTEY
jgi:hypothetical protein